MGARATNGFGNGLEIGRGIADRNVADRGEATTIEARPVHDGGFRHRLGSF